ncbi:MAG: ABC transporter substrate-binding protein [Sulfobacillus acidophilus]|uniref:ABC transporter substrate-binding protein n=1 Tax=Sulfobacillus acidophilus TaxID=53633 RepID=A0A2T2WL55_9FIRM|nr:MAG: ABC transporter substrate-binding protein [Sulfobacillus acidophilus]
MTVPRHIVASVASLAVGVLGLQASPPVWAAATNAPHQGGTIVVAMTPGVAPNGFLPIYSSATFTNINIQLSALLYKPLLDITPSDTIDFHRSIASRITWNPSGTVYTITLGHRYHWSNGQPITAADIVFSWQIIRAASQPNAPWVFGGQGFGGIPTRWKSVVAVNPSTVRITLNQPSNQEWFIHNGINQLTPLPQSVWDRYPTNMHQELLFLNRLQNSPLAPQYRVVDGPFRLTQYTPNDEWIFTPNPNYGGHRAYISRLIFQYETSDANEFIALKGGTVQVGYVPFALLSSARALSADAISPFYAFGFNYLDLNMSSKAGFIGRQFSQLYVRQALQMGINQPAMIKSFYHNEAVEDFSPIPAKPRTEFFDPSLKNPYPFDPRRGRALMEQHGWHLDHGVWTKGGHRFAFTLMYGNGSIAANSSLQLLAYDWGQEGFDVHLEPENASTAFGVMVGPKQSAWQMAYFPEGYWTYEPDYYPTGGGLFLPHAGGNYSHYQNATMNQLIAATYRPATTLAQSQARMFRYEAWAAHDLPVLYMPYYPALLVHSDSVHGVVRTENPVSILYSANDWWVS